MQNYSLRLDTPVYNLAKTIILSVLLLVMFFGSQLIGVALFTPLVMDSYLIAFADKVALGSQNGSVMSLAIGFTLIVVLVLVFILIRLQHGKVKSYLALQLFQAKPFFICLVLLIALNVFINAVTIWLNREPMLFMDDLAKSAQPLWLLVVAMVVFAPIYEEVMFRGFIWTGLASSQLGVLGASFTTSLLFAVIHLQYGLVELVGIFCLALLFSYARIISGSLFLPITLHIINNGLAMGEYLSG